MSGTANRLYAQPWPEGEYRFFQLGFVVPDLIEAASRWASVHRVGPFHVLPVVEQRLIVKSEPATVSMQVGVAQAGPVQIELIQQHCDRPSIYRGSSAIRSPSFHQLATVTADYDAKVEHFAKLGYEPAAESIGGSLRVAYFDTVGDFGFYTEVIEHTPSLLRRLGAISQTCAHWDGTDPVRLLTRDGYRVP